MAIAEVSVIDNTITVEVGGSELLAPLVAAAEASVAAAEGFADAAEAASAAATATLLSATEQAAINARVKVAGVLPIGWVDPADNGITYPNDYSVSLYSDGLSIRTYRAETSAVRNDWKGTQRRLLAGVSMVEVKLELVYDPTLQGVAASVRYVHNVTGNDANNGLTPETAWKTVDYAIATTQADGAIAVADIRADTSTFFGGNSAGWTAGTPTITKPTKITNVSTGSKWLLPGMRNSYTKALFAWTDMGGGIWKCSTGSISTAAKNTNVVFDLSVLDEDGAPTPSVSLAGPYADEAAILAAMATGPSFFYQSATTSLYVRLASGAEPDPGVNYGYVESGSTNYFQIEEGGRLYIKGFRAIHNAGSASGVTWWSARPKTYTIGASAPNVVHDNVLVMVDSEIYGSSGHSFTTLSMHRGLFIRCKAKYGWLDGVNPHTLYVYPASSNSVNEGEDDHIWIEDCVFSQLGPNLFKAQDVVNNSCNAVTSHERTPVTTINTTGVYTHGAVVAAASGSKIFAFGCNFAEPFNATIGDGTTSQKTCYWAQGYAAGATSEGSIVATIHCTGQVKNDGVMFYADTNAKVIAGEFRGKKSKRIVVSSPFGAAVVDGTGAAI